MRDKQEQMDRVVILAIILELIQEEVEPVGTQLVVMVHHIMVMVKVELT